MLRNIVSSLKQRIERWQSQLESDSAYQKRTGFDPTVRPQYGDVIAYCHHISVFPKHGPIMHALEGVSVARHNADSFIGGMEVRIDWIATCLKCAEEISDEGPSIGVRLLKPSFKLPMHRLIWKWPLP